MLDGRRHITMGTVTMATFATHYCCRYYSNCCHGSLLKLGCCCCYRRFWRTGVTLPWWLTGFSCTSFWSWPYPERSRFSSTLRISSSSSTRSRSSPSLRAVRTERWPEHHDHRFCSDGQYSSPLHRRDLPPMALYKCSHSGSAGPTPWERRRRRRLIVFVMLLKATNQWYGQLCQLERTFYVKVSVPVPVVAYSRDFESKVVTDSVKLIQDGSDGDGSTSINPTRNERGRNHSAVMENVCIYKFSYFSPEHEGNFLNHMWGRNILHDCKLEPCPLFNTHSCERNREILYWKALIGETSQFHQWRHLYLWRDTINGL